MKSKRVWLSIAFLLMLSVFGATYSSGDIVVVEDFGPRCSCNHPVTGHYGTICRIGPFWECCPTDCWIPL